MREDSGFQELAAIIRTTTGNSSKKRKTVQPPLLKAPVEFLTGCTKDEVVEMLMDTVDSQFDEGEMPSHYEGGLDSFTSAFYSAMCMSTPPTHNPLLERLYTLHHQGGVSTRDLALLWEEAYCTVCCADMSKRHGHIIGGHVKMHHL